MKKRLLDLVRHLRKREKDACAQGAARSFDERRAAERVHATASARRDAEKARLSTARDAERQRLANGALRAQDLVLGEAFQRGSESELRAHDERVRAASRDVRAAERRDGAARDALGRAHARERIVEERAALTRAEERARDERREEAAAEDDRNGRPFAEGRRQ